MPSNVLRFKVVIHSMFKLKLGYRIENDENRMLKMDSIY